MTDFSGTMVVPLTIRFFDRVIEKTRLKRRSEAAIMFNWIRVQIPITCMMSEGRHMMSFAKENTLKAECEQDFRDLIKTVWTVARNADASSKHRLICFFIGAGSLSAYFFMSSVAHPESQLWVDNVENGIAAFLTQVCPTGSIDERKRPSRGHEAKDNKYKYKPDKEPNMKDKRESEKKSDADGENNNNKDAYKNDFNSSRFNGSTKPNKSDSERNEGIGKDKSTNESEPNVPNSKDDLKNQNVPKPPNPTAADESWFSTPKSKYQPSNYEPPNYEPMPSKPIIRGKTKSGGAKMKPEGRGREQKAKDEAKVHKARRREPKGSPFRNKFDKWRSSQSPSKGKPKDDAAKESDQNEKEKKETSIPADKEDASDEEPTETKTTYSSRYDKWSKEKTKYESKPTTHEFKEPAKPAKPVIRGKSKGKTEPPTVPKTRYEKWFQNQKGQDEPSKKETPKEEPKPPRPMRQSNGSRTRYEKWINKSDPNTEENESPKSDDTDPSNETEEKEGDNPSPGVSTPEPEEVQSRKTRYDKWIENQRNTSDPKFNPKSTYQKWLNTRKNDEDTDAVSLMDIDEAVKSETTKQIKATNSRSRYENWANKSFTVSEDEGNCSINEPNCETKSEKAKTNEETMSFSPSDMDDDDLSDVYDNSTDFNWTNRTQNKTQNSFRTDIETLESVPEIDNEEEIQYSDLRETSV